MTTPRRPPVGESDVKFPTKQLIVLAICRIAEPIAFTSVLSYAYIMVKDLLGDNDTNASFYAGLLVSAFAVAEACTAMIWGTVSDVYGRKPVILFGLAGTALSNLLFGFATNIWVALAARVVGGLLNGNVAVMQTMVAELCTKPEFEPRAYAMPPFMWSLGTIVGAAMGGFLAQPAVYFPTVFSPDGLFGKYPYLLPNLVAVVFIVLAIIQGYFLMEETNPRLLSQVSVRVDRTDPVIDETTSLISEINPTPEFGSTLSQKRRLSFVCGSMPTTTEPNFDIRRKSITGIDHVENITPGRQDDVFHEEQEEVVNPFNRNVLLWIIALVVMCYHQMAYASLLPIYLLEDPVPSQSVDLKGGLGYTVHDVGTFMSVNGIIAMIIQIVVFPPFMSRVGVRRSLLWLVSLCPGIYVVVPVLSLLPHKLFGQQVGLYVIMVIQNFFLIIIYPCLLIALKNAVPNSSVLGKVNGLAMSATSGARTIAPPVCGIIYSAGGSAVAWWSVAVVAVLGMGELYFIEQPDDSHLDNTTAENGTA